MNNQSEVYRSTQSDCILALLCPPFLGFLLFIQTFYYFSGVRQKIPLFVLFLTLCEQSAPLSYSLVTQSEPLPTAKSQSLFSFSHLSQHHFLFFLSDLDITISIFI